MFGSFGDFKDFTSGISKLAGSTLSLDSLQSELDPELHDKQQKQQQQQQQQQQSSSKPAVEVRSATNPIRPLALS
jgi:hypothetical protein